MIEIWERITQYFYNSVLKQKASGRAKRSITNMDDAKSVGIVYDSTNPDHDIAITKFAEMLRHQGKTVDVLDYINDKKIDHKGDIKIFNPKGVNWYGIPNDERALAFADRNFDLLICAITSENKPLEYLAYISKSKYRVGPFDEQKTQCYDLMIDIGSKKDINYLLQQMLHFLSSIKYQ